MIETNKLTILGIGIIVALIISAVGYFWVYAFSREYLNKSIEISQEFGVVGDTAEYAKVTISGGQFLWTHSLIYSRSVVSTSLDISSDYVALPTTVQIGARRGEVFNVCIEYFNNTVVFDIPPDSINVYVIEKVKMGEITFSVTM